MKILQISMIAALILLYKKESYGNDTERILLPYTSVLTQAEVRGGKNILRILIRLVA